MWNTFRSVFSRFSSTAEGYNSWREHALRFGIGRKLDIDLPVESKGSLPETSYYNRIYGEGHWNAMTVRSLAIGQGELGVTPLQLANYCSAVANRGYFYAPHVIREIEEDDINSNFKIKNEVGISPQYFEPVIEGMAQAIVNTGLIVTSRIPGVEMCGKTGTAENPHGSDHSIFMGFAPRDNPEIAISVYIENGVWGARYAAPIASLIMEKYLNDTIADNRKWIETRMTEANLLNPNQPK